MGESYNKSRSIRVQTRAEKAKRKWNHNGLMPLCSSFSRSPSLCHISLKPLLIYSKMSASTSSHGFSGREGGGGERLIENTAVMAPKARSASRLEWSAARFWARISSQSAVFELYTPAVADPKKSKNPHILYGVRVVWRYGLTRRIPRARCRAPISRVVIKLYTYIRYCFIRKHTLTHGKQRKEATRHRSCKWLLL